jgi:hypothetical protein
MEKFGGDEECVSRDGGVRDEQVESVVCTLRAVEAGECRLGMSRRESTFLVALLTAEVKEGRDCSWPEHQESG